MSIKHKILSKINDETYLKMLYRIKMKKKLDLKNPKTFNEKMQWLKLNDRKDIYTTMVDKYEAKKYVSNIIGEEHIIPTLGIYDKFEDIDFDALPNQFVLKCTHDSGGIVICKDKNKLDIEEVKKKITKSLKNNYYHIFREWPYKNVKPRIIAEKYMENDDGTDICDYKFYCFDGKCEYVLMCADRQTGNTKFYFLNRKGEFMEKFTRDAIKYEEELKTRNTASNLEEMFQIAEKLAGDIKFIRVDLYNINGKIYFGELTFYPSSGFDANRLDIADKMFTEKLKI